MGTSWGSVCYTLTVHNALSWWRRFVDYGYRFVFLAILPQCTDDGQQSSLPETKLGRVNLVKNAANWGGKSGGGHRWNDSFDDGGKCYYCQVSVNVCPQSSNSTSCILSFYYSLITGFVFERRLRPEIALDFCLTGQYDINFVLALCQGW